MLQTPKRTKPPVIKTISLHDFLKGRRTDTDITRTDNTGLAITDDVMLEQDGVISPRPATVPYGVQPLGEVLGIDTFTRIVNGMPESWLITVQWVSGVGKCFVSKDGGSWTECTGATYAKTPTTFVQGNGKVLILNRSDFGSFLDTNTFTITSYVQLPTPAAPTVTGTGLTGLAITYRYRITAVSSVGETNGSVAGTVTSSVARTQWSQTGSTPRFATISWAAITDTKGYCIYVGTEAGKEVFIGSVPAGTTQFIDDGSSVEVVTKKVPESNGTRGPVCERGANVAGQIYLIGDKTNPYRVWYGGSGDNTFDFSSFNGGGWIDISVGSKFVPVAIVSFRDGKGTPMATVFSDGASGAGKITHLSLQSMNYGDTTLTYMQADEANGQDGTGAPGAIVMARDSLWYPSGDTFKTTGTKPQVQNILSTNNISDGILTDMRSINYGAISGASGVVNDGRIYWALPIGSSYNSQIWVLDLVRGGQWMLPWRFAAKKLLIYGSNDRKSHFIALTQDNKIVEFTQTRATEDSGTGFPTRVGSGYIKSEKSGAAWMYIIDVLVTLINPQGNINVEVKAKTKEAAVASLTTKKFLSETSYAGWGEVVNTNGGWGQAIGNGDIGWGQVITIPAKYGASRVTKLIPVKKAVNYLQWIISTTEKGAYYSVSDVVIRYVDIGIVTTEDMRR